MVVYKLEGPPARLLIHSAIALGKLSGVITSCERTEERVMQQIEALGRPFILIIPNPLHT